MFAKIKGGSSVNVQGLICQLPPVGFVVNVLTGKLEQRDIIARSRNDAEQYWELQFIPEWINKRTKIEEKRQLLEPDYVDIELENYRAQEWDRRLNGCWFMNNGSPVFLTGTHYFFLQWWKIDVDKTKYRLPDLEYFYFLQYCIEDPQCFGCLEVTKRRFGKSYRAGLFAYEYPSRTKNAQGGMQSKTMKDGKKLFNKTVIRPFRKLPPFFRPEYDTSQGINPKSELLFQQTNIRGKHSETLLEKVELGSMIDFQSSELLAYDGQKIHRYVRDESLKTFEVNVYDGLDVVRYCLQDDEGKIIGKALYTSTVEIEEEGKKGRTRKEASLVDQVAKKLWDESDHMDKEGRKQTKSGLYRFFMPSYRARCFDLYGIPNETKAKVEILEDWKTVEHDAKRLASRRRKEPMTIQHAFGESGFNCHFNAELLNDRIEFMGWNKPWQERGNYVWKDGVPYSSVVWVKDNQNGRWTRYWDFQKESMRNNVEKIGNLFYPKNKVQLISACDPYQNSITQETRSSMGSSHVLLQFDNEAESIYTDAFISEYHARPKMVTLFYEDMIKQCFYYGVPLLYESNKPGIKDYMIDKGFEAFLIRIPGYKDYGIPATTENKTLMVNLWEEYIENRNKRIYSLRMCEQLLKFDVLDTEKFDIAMSGGWTLVAKYYRRHKMKEENPVAITDYFREYKIA